MSTDPASRARKSAIPGALAVGLGATLIVPAAADARDPDAETSRTPAATSSTDYHSLYHEQMDQAAKAAPAPKPAAAPPRPAAKPKPAAAPKPAAKHRDEPESSEPTRQASPTTDYHSYEREQQDQARKRAPKPVATPKRVSAPKPKPAKPKPPAATPTTDYHSLYHERMDRAAKATPTPRPAAPTPKPATSTPKPATPAVAATTPPAAPPKPAATAPPAATPTPATDYHSRYHEQMDRVAKATPAPKPAATPTPTPPAATPKPAAIAPPAATAAPATPATDYHSRYHEQMDRAAKTAPKPTATPQLVAKTTPAATPRPNAPATDYHTLYHQRMDQAMRNAPFDASQMLDPTGNVINIGNAPKIAPPAGLLLPFPGSEGQRVSVGTTCGGTRDAGGGASKKCTGLPPVYEGTHRPPARAGITAETTITGTEGRTKNVMTPYGEQANLQVSAEVLAKVGGEAKLKELEVGYKRVAKGRKIVYQITASPSRIDEISRNPALAPKANDPRTLGVGDSILVNRESFAGLEGSLKVKNVAGEYSEADGDRQSAGVQRVDAKTIRITVGNEKFLRQLAKMGVGLDNDLASIGVYGASDSARGDLRQVDLDVTKKEGWDDYQSFMATGRVPYHPDSKFATAKRDASDSTSGLYVKFGPAELSTTGMHHARDERTVRNSDGTWNVVGSRTTEGITMTYDQKTERDGKAGELRMSLLLRNVDPAAVKYYASKSGDAPATDGDHDDVRIDFTDEDLDKLQDLAITRIQRLRDERGLDKLSRQDIIDGKGDGDVLTTERPDLWIAKSKNRAQRLMHLFNDSYMNSNDALEHLADPGGDQDSGAPGHVTVLRD